MPVQWKTHLPWPGEDVRILDRRFVHERVRTGRRITLDYVQRLAREIPCPIEPGVAVESGDVHNERVALPAAVRPAHPEIDGRFLVVLQLDDAGRVAVPEHHENLVRHLHELKRI